MTTVPTPSVESGPVVYIPTGRRHPLGLPVGSVRALLTFMVLGLTWVLLLIPENEPRPVPLYLYYLIFLILGHYFAARSYTPVVSGLPERPPLYLPRGTIRFLIVIGFIAVVGWGFYNDPHFIDRLTPPVSEQPHLPIIILGAFFLGIVIGRLAERIGGSLGPPPVFQDLVAWVSLLAMLALAAEMVIRLVINPTLPAEKQLNLPSWEGFLGAVVAFYFGVRS